MREKEPPKVVELAPLRHKLRVRELSKFCEHHRLWVDQELRMLVCQDCETVIDPFDYLMRRANEDQFAETESARWRLERQQLAEDIKVLKREENRLRSRIRKAGFLVRKAVGPYPCVQVPKPGIYTLRLATDEEAAEANLSDGGEG